MYICTLFFSLLFQSGHLSSLTEIIVAAWSIGLGVLLLLFFSHCFGDQQLFLIILVTIIDYFYFFNYMSSCKFYHDCILAPKSVKKTKQNKKNWLDTYKHPRRSEIRSWITQWESHKSGQLLLGSVPWNRLKCIWQSLLLQPLKMSQQLAVLPLDIPVKSFFCCLLNIRF